MLHKYTITPKDDFVEVLRQIEERHEEEVELFLCSGIYFTKGTDQDCLKITIPKLTICAEDNTVIYDNRGHLRNCFPKENNPSSLAHTLLFLGKELILKNITIVNGCNIDFEYQEITYPKVSDVVTQAYALGVWNAERFEAYNSTFLSILDTFDLRNVESLYMQGCHTQGNNDFIAVANKALHKECSFKILGPCPMWSASRDYMIFYKCCFDVELNESDTLYMTKRGGNFYMLECSFTSNALHLQMEIDTKRESRYYLYNNSYNGYNLPLRGYQENFIYVNEHDVKEIITQAVPLKLTIEGPITIDKEADFYSSIPLDTSDVRCSKFFEVSCRGNKIHVMNHCEGKNQEGFIKIKSGFLQAILYVGAIGKKVEKCEVIEDLSYRIENGSLFVEYEVLGEDSSIIDVYQNDVLLYRLNPKTKHFPISIEDIGQNFTIALTPMTLLTLPSDEVCITTRVIEKEDVASRVCFADTSILQLKNKNHLFMQNIEAKYLGDEVLGFVRFEQGSDECFTYMSGTDNALNKYGLVPTVRGAGLIYPVADSVSEYKVSMLLYPEKKSGEGFGSANGQYLELWMNYSSGAGIALRIEREVCSDRGCMISIREYKGWTNHICSEKIFSTCFRGTCEISATYINKELMFKVENEEGKVELSYPLDKINTSFMLRHTGTVGVGNRFVLQKIEYTKK